MKEQKTSKIPEMSSLPDPQGNRQVKEVLPPVHLPLSAELLFNASISSGLKNRQKTKLEDFNAPLQERRSIDKGTCARDNQTGNKHIP